MKLSSLLARLEDAMRSAQMDDPSADPEVVCPQWAAPDYRHLRFMEPDIDDLSTNDGVFLLTIAAGIHATTTPRTARATGSGERETV